MSQLLTTALSFYSLSGLFEAAAEFPLLYRILIIAAIAAGAHLIVTLVRRISQLVLLGRKPLLQAGASDFSRRYPRTATVITIMESLFTFLIYFLALGLILQEFNLSLRAYLASTTVIGLAIGFGSQGFVQDIVIGLTLIFSNLLKVGDVVEVSGQIGRVESVGMRFTILTNLHGQRVHLPNRNIGVISQYRGGCIRAYVDFQIPEKGDARQTHRIVWPLAEALYSQHRAIVMEMPEHFGVRRTTDGGWTYIRYKFKLWPGQGSLIENSFRLMALSRLRAHYPDYAEWMVHITYRSERFVARDGELIDESDSDEPSGDPQV